MNSFRLHIRNVALLVVLVVVVAGCGGADETATTTAQQTPQPAAPAPNPGDSTLVSDTPGGATGAADTGAGTGTVKLPPLSDSESEDDAGGLLGSLSGALFQPKAKLDESSDSSTTTGTDYSQTPSGTSTTDQFTTDGQYTGTPTTSEDPEPTSTKTYTAAQISVNGKVHSVQKKSVFPSDSQQFRVTSIGADFVIIELMAGVFADGSNAVTLEQGTSRKFVNQDERVSYTLKLQSTS